jgi:folate-binding protein YgfZ
MTDTTPGMLEDRAVLRIAGDDVRGFLQGLVTNDVAALAPDRPIWAGLLTPQGKALFDFILWDGGQDTVLIDCEATQADALAKRLTMYRLRRAITIERSPLAVHWSPDGSLGVPDPRLAALGGRWLGEPGEPAQGWLAHRLSLGVTEGVAELGNGDTLWLECNARECNGVSFTKGCYVGQENTARMHHRGKVNRRLVVVPISEAGDRTRVRYPAMGLMVEHRRVEALGNAIVPEWLVSVV